MIFDGLHTPFKIYDDIDKQNRYRDVCEEVCNFRLLCPINTILPFQFSFEYNGDAEYYSWSIRCASDNELYKDMIDYAGFLEIDDFPDVETTCVSFMGDFTGSKIPFELPCGVYYLQIEMENEAGIHMFYSEVFEVADRVNDPSYRPSIPTIYSAWVWHSNSGMLSENREPCLSVCKYFVRCGNDALLPFQYLVSSAENITSWTLIGQDCEFTLDASQLIVQPMGDYFNVIYDGFLIDLPCGMFYSQMVIDGETHYSEPIYISNDFETAGTNYILQEDGDKLLQENSYGLLHEP